MSIDEKLRKDLGINTERYMNDVIMSDDYAIFNVSPSVDMTCGGGIREGSVVLICGAQKLGKSSLCLQICANAQNHNDKIKRKAYYIDVENKLEKRDILGMHNLKIEPEYFEPVGSIDGDILYAENTFKFIENLISSEKNNIIVLDSISMFLTKAEAQYDFTSDKTYMSNLARQTAIFLRKMVQLIRPTRNTLLVITHDYANIGAMPGQSKKAESGGTKVQYTSNYKFKLTHKSDLKASASDSAKIGHEVFFKCDHTPMDGAGGNSSFYHLFGYGLDDVTEYLMLAKQFGIIKASGAWFNFPNGEKAQGKVNARKALLDDKELYQSVKESVDEFIRS